MDYKIMNQQKGLDQIPSKVDNPENNGFNEQDKMKAGQTKKKGFKIKKNKHLSLKKLNNVDVFNNPIYAGLQNQQRNDQYEMNFGPWIHDHMLRQQRYRRTTIVQPHIQTPIQNNYQNVQRAGSSNEAYLQIPIREAILQQTDNTVLTYLPQIQLKPKRQVHQMRISSLDFTIQSKSLKKQQSSQTLSPPKHLKNKTTLLCRNKSQNNILNTIKYETLKQIPLSQRLLYGKKKPTKPSNVIYNYCYSNNENNIFLNSYKDNQFYLRDSYYNNHQHSSVFNSIKTQKDQVILRKINIKNNNLKNNQIKNNIDKNQSIQPLRKSISKELYQDLIKKKNKCK